MPGISIASKTAVFLWTHGGYILIYTERWARKCNYKHISWWLSDKSSGFNLDEWELDRLSRLQQCGMVTYVDVASSRYQRMGVWSRNLGLSLLSYKLCVFRGEFFRCRAGDVWAWRLVERHQVPTVSTWVVLIDDKLQETIDQ